MGLTAAAGGFILLLLSGSVHLPHAREEQCEGRFSGPVTSVRDPNLQVNVNGGGFLVNSWAKLQCVSQCCLPSQPSYIWYRNGHRVEDEESSVYGDIFDNSDSIYCAVKGLENFPSPQICVHMNSCDKMIYTEQKIIAVSGSSVDISCTYSGGGYKGLKFWFSPERSHLWRNLSTPEDLSKDPQYAGRVMTSVRRGRFTLRITNLRQTDSAQYRFQIDGRFNALPGTTLIVTALQVQVIRITATQAVTEAQLRCQSSCSPAGPLSYVWFKNGQKHRTENSSTYTDQFQPGDNVSCAFIGYEDYRSPSINPCRLPSVSVSPSGQIVEGSSVTLSCSSDVEAAADYTWYKEDEASPLASGQNFTLTHVRLEHSGNYSCEVQDRKGRGRYKSMLHLSVVTNPNRFPSVSVSPSGQIVEGSSVTLSCSSDVEAAADYTWYKEDEASPLASGQNFTITHVRLEHSGNYSCEVQDRKGRGRYKSMLHLSVVTKNLTVLITNTIRLTLLVLLLLSVLLVNLWTRKKKEKTQHFHTEPTEFVEMREK